MLVLSHEGSAKVPSSPGLDVDCDTKASGTKAGFQWMVLERGGTILNSGTVGKVLNGPCWSLGLDLGGQVS